MLLAAILLALLVKTFVVQAFYIPSPSMVPGLVEDDRILVEKPSYWSGDSSRCLCAPQDDVCNPADAYVDVDLVVGRVVAVVWPGDHTTWLHRPDTFADVPDAP